MYSAQNAKDRIRSICKKKNINAHQMLLDCKLGTNAIQQINDTKGMASFSLAKIADYLDVSVDYLLGRTDDPLGGVSGEPAQDLIIYSRDGKTVKKKMSKDAMRLLTSMLDALPEDDNPDL